MDLKVEYISAGCNCTYNCVQLIDNFIVYGSNKAIAIYDLQEEKVLKTLSSHTGRVNCIRFIKNTNEANKWLITCCSGGVLILWELIKGNAGDEQITFVPRIRKEYKGVSLTVCDGISLSTTEVIVGCITTESLVDFYKVDVSAGTIDIVQEMNLKKSLANDLVFHSFGDQDMVLALGMDSGSVILHEVVSPIIPGTDLLKPLTTLTKHEDWVRCIDFVKLENGETLMATGGEDSFIAVWRFTKSIAEQSSFEFQVHKFKDHSVVFDSMIIGHEGWINSLNFKPNGELISCSSDQSIIIWENIVDLWIEKSRFGVTGGNTPGGFGAKFNEEYVISSGFQGAIQIWVLQEGEWVTCPSVTGHFNSISDFDYNSNGQYIVTTSEDQTTRVHAPWGINRWHEISRPQIHGHDLFACRFTYDDKIVSGAEEKILRAFQPTEIFFKNLEDTSEVIVDKKDAVRAAFLPALGLSNQTEVKGEEISTAVNDSIDVRLDEDFIRSQTLWLEVSKLYGHVYEIACIASSPVDPLIASASQASKPQFAAIILWCSDRWKNLGEFPHHKLNVTGMEFSNDGKKLLSVSRDRTWAVWNVLKNDSSNYFIEVLSTGSLHTRALWVGTWAPSGDYFVTGARDKKLMVWRQKSGNDYELETTQSFDSSVSAAAINFEGTITVGLESGIVEVMQYNPTSDSEFKLSLLLKLDNSQAHQDTVKRIKFNPKDQLQFASAGTDNLLKVYEIKLL